MAIDIRRDKMLTSNDVIAKFQEKFNEVAPGREYLFVMCLSAKQEILRIAMVSVGTIHYFDPIIREAIRPALEVNAASIVIAHNHPSGDATPSLGDIRFTNELIELCTRLDIRVLDHLILGDPGVYSMQRNGGFGVNIDQLKFLGGSDAE